MIGRLWPNEQPLTNYCAGAGLDSSKVPVHDDLAIDEMTAGASSAQHCEQQA